MASVSVLLYSLLGFRRRFSWSKAWFMVVVRWRSRSLITRRLSSFRFLGFEYLTAFDRAVFFAFEMAFGATFGTLYMLTVGWNGRFGERTWVLLLGWTQRWASWQTWKNLKTWRSKIKEIQEKRKNLQKCSEWTRWLQIRNWLTLATSRVLLKASGHGTSRSFLNTVKVSNTMSAVDRSLGWCLMVRTFW